MYKPIYANCEQNNMYMHELYSIDVSVNVATPINNVVTRHDLATTRPNIFTTVKGVI